MRADEGDAPLVAHAPVGINRVEVAHAVLADQDTGQMVMSVEAQQQLVEALGIDLPAHGGAGPFKHDQAVLPGGKIAGDHHAGVVV